MFGGISTCYAGGRGSTSLKRNQGKKGLRNKRRAHWARERKIEDILADKREKALSLINESYGDDYGDEGWSPR